MLIETGAPASFASFQTRGAVFAVFSAWCVAQAQFRYWLHRSWSSDLEDVFGRGDPRLPTRTMHANAEVRHLARSRGASLRVASSALVQPRVREQGRHIQKSRHQLPGHSGPNQLLHLIAAARPSPPSLAVITRHAARSEARSGSRPGVRGVGTDRMAVRCALLPHESTCSKQQRGITFQEMYYCLLRGAASGIRLGHLQGLWLQPVWTRALQLEAGIQPWSSSLLLKQPP